MGIKTVSYLTGLLCLLVGSVVRADSTPQSRAIVEAAIADSRRPADQVKLDVTRRPAVTVLFSEAKAGDRIVDFMSGNAYFTRILSQVVGPTGHIYAYIPTEQIAHCSPQEIAGTQAVARDSNYRNVTLVTGSLGDLRFPNELDLVWMSQSYHDLHDSFLGPPDVAAVNKAIFQALKPGGIFVVVDHVAETGSELRDTDTLHRIDPIRMKREIEAAGFVLEAQSDALRNADDDHKLAVLSPSIRGRTDQVLFRFRRPR